MLQQPDDSGKPVEGVGRWTCHLYESVADGSHGFTADVMEELLTIRNGEWAQPVTHVRALLKNGDKKGSADAKRRLAAHCWAGTFSKKGRGNANLVAATGLVPIDIDFDVIEPSAFDRINDGLKGMPSCLAAWVSAGGVGLKALIVLAEKPRDASDYKRWYAVAAKAVRDATGIGTATSGAVKIGGLDEGGSDVSRACFVSYDSDMYIADTDSLQPLARPETEDYLDRLLGLSGTRPAPDAGYPDDVDVDRLLWTGRRFPKDSNPDRSDWLAVSGSYKVAGGVCETWRDWNARDGWPVTDAEWRGLPTDQYTIGTLIWYWKSTPGNELAAIPRLPYAFTLEGATRPCRENRTWRANAYRYLSFDLPPGESLVVVCQPGHNTIPAQVFVRGTNGLLDRGTAENLPERVGQRYLEACGNMSKDDSAFGACVQHSRLLGETKYLPDLLQQLPNAVETLKGAGLLPKHVEIINPDALDFNPPLWGFADCVVDLDTGRKATPEALQGSLVSATIPRAFNPDGRVADVDHILPPVGEGTARQQIYAQVVGYLARNPGGANKRFVMEICPANSGKTTAANLLVRGCGPYIRKASASTFGVASRSSGAMAYNNNLALVSWPTRILFVPEVTGTLDIDLLKELAGGEGTIDQRTIGEGNRRLVVSATAWFHGNEGAGARFGVGTGDDNADAMKSRAVGLLRETIPEPRDRRFLDLGAGDSATAVAVKQAVAARVVEYAVAFGQLPFPNVPQEGLDREIAREQPAWRSQFLAGCMESDANREPDALPLSGPPTSTQLHGLMERWADANEISRFDLPKQAAFTKAVNKHFDAKPVRAGRGSDRPWTYFGWRLAGAALEHFEDWQAEGADALEPLEMVDGTEELRRNFPSASVADNVNLADIIDGL